MGHHTQADLTLAAMSNPESGTLRLFAIVHEHRHGVDVYHVLAHLEPDAAVVIVAHGSTYEPEREESARVIEVTLPGSALRPGPVRDEAGFYPLT